jgi:hypothetical protein
MDIHIGQDLALCQRLQSMEIAKRYQSKYIIIFKRGFIPGHFDAYSFLKKLSKENMVDVSDEKISKKYFWVCGMEHKGYVFDNLELHKKKEDIQTRFVCLANFKLTFYTCLAFDSL